MIIQENIPLAQYTTFKIGGPARFFCIATNEDELLEAVAFAKEKAIRSFVLGGGSNVLMNDKGFDGLVVKIDIRGVKIQDSHLRQGYGGQAGFKMQEGAGSDLVNAEKVLVSVGAGENWDDLVEQTVEKGFYGLENLSAIPGTVGAAPVQNIGAYGGEVSKTIVAVRVLDQKTMKYIEMTNSECQFSYRDSIFKREKNHYVITRVDFALLKNGTVNTEYKDVKDYFIAKGNKKPTIQEVRDAVVDIRWNKLPDWKLWGTAGSFFKNPKISSDQFDMLKNKYPGLPGFPESDGRVKVSLGWILDKVCNAKGICKGNACVYEKQALVLIAKPGATSEEIVNLAQELMTAVKEKTGIEIEGEVEWVN